MATKGNKKEGLEKMLSVEEVANNLGLSKKTIYKLVKKKQLTAYRLVNKLRFKPEDIREYVDRHKT